MNRPIYLHVFDRELRTYLHAQMSDGYVCNVVITASLLSDDVYIPNSNLMESKNDFPKAVELIYELEKTKQSTIIVTSDNPGDFIVKRQKLYQAVKDRYPMYFDEKSIQFPCLPFVLPDSTTEYLRKTILRKTDKIIPTGLFNKFQAFRSVLKSGDENGVTVEILDKQLGFTFQERCCAADLISESYTSRYLNVMDGILMKHISGLSHFDYISDGDIYFDHYYPIVNLSILRFLKNEDGGYCNEVAFRIAQIKNDPNYPIFITLLKKAINLFNKKYFKEKYTDEDKRAHIRWKTEYNKYLITPFSRIKELNIPEALSILSSVIKKMETDFKMNVESEPDQNLSIKTVLYVVATVTELKKITDYYKSKGVKISPITNDSHTYWDLGIIRKNHVYLIKCEMGAKKPNASILTIDQAITFIKPDFIIMVGIAFALKEEKLKIGDIMVATELLDYGSVKRSNGRIVERGVRATSDKTLLDRFTNAIVDWNGSNVRFGLLITNDILSDDENFVKELRERFPDAIGGEMEGCGLLANPQIPWIMVKSVCDYGYHKDDESQVMAANSAIEYVDYVLNEFDL